MIGTPNTTANTAVLADPQEYAMFFPNNLTPPVQRARVDNRGDLVYQGDLVIEDIPNKQLRDDIRRLRSVECWHRVGDCFNALVRTGNCDDARALLSWEEMMKSCANVLFDPRYGGDVIPRERHKACLPCRERKLFCIHNEDGSVDPDRKRKHLARH
ncbi:MAG: hypothetical protein ASARMPREDX12_000522 [Alectoria sarmentosa]|nr:MAG: hypothetical protein ASARMPREDX12_000522 [Alectoria sarmentosa]